MLRRLMWLLWFKVGVHVAGYLRTSWKVVNSRGPGTCAIHLWQVVLEVPGKDRGQPHLKRVVEVRGGVCGAFSYCFKIADRRVVKPLRFIMSKRRELKSPNNSCQAG